MRKVNKHRVTVFMNELHRCLLKPSAWYFWMFECLWNITSAIKIPWCVYFNPLNLQCAYSTVLHKVTVAHLVVFFFFSFIAWLTETQWSVCAVQTQPLFSLKITCHPPPLHNSISVSIKVGCESFKTEKRHTIRCLPWKPFHCQLPVRESVCMCACERERSRERERAHRLCESLTVWPSALRLLAL